MHITAEPVFNQLSSLFVIHTSIVILGWTDAQVLETPLGLRYSMQVQVNYMQVYIGRSLRSALTSRTAALDYYGGVN